MVRTPANTLIRASHAFRKRNAFAFRAVMLFFLVVALGCGQVSHRGEDSIAARELCRLGLAAMDGHRWQEAKTRFAHALKASPEDPEARRHLAQVLWKQGDTYAAIVQLHGAIELIGSQPQWTVELGEMFLATNDLDRARQCADLATELAPQLATAWVLRGHVLRRQGDFDEALGNFHLARSHGADDDHIALAVADIYARQNRPARVLASLPTAVIEPELQADVAIRRGQALLAMGRHDDAVTTLSLARATQPQNQQLLLALAEAQLVAGDLSAARHTVVESQPDNSQRRLELVTRIDEAQSGVMIR